MITDEILARDHSMTRLILLFTLVLIQGCASYDKLVLPLDQRVMRLHGEARPQEAIAEFFEEETIEDAYLIDLTTVVGSFLVAHDFKNADLAIKQILKDGDQTDEKVAIGQTYQSSLYFSLGNYSKAKQIALLNIKHEDQDFPLGEYRFLGMIAAMEGKHEEARNWMQKIESLEYKVLFFSLGGDMTGKLKKDARARILLAMGDAAGAKDELNRAIPGKTFGDYIFDWAIDYTRTDFEKNLDKVLEWVAPKDVGAWNILFDIQVLALYAQVELANENYPSAVQSLRRLLSYPNIEQNRIFYTQALVDLSRAYAGMNKMKAAEKFRKMALEAIQQDAQKIPWPEEKKNFRAQFKLD